VARLKAAVLISGAGTNLQALIDAAARPGYPAEIVRVVSNREDAGGIARAERAGIPVAIIPHRSFPDRAGFDAAIDAELRRAGAELVCLAGFMRLFTEGFVESWRDRLVNIHPALLPAFKGIHVHERVLQAGVKLTGCTVHFTRPAMDEGPIIVQAAVPVLPGDDLALLAARVHRAEHLAYPLAVRLIGEGRVRVEGECAVIDGGEWSETPFIAPAG
jgi:phosphoribosylglycinamide formyltransferase-1